MNVFFVSLGCDKNLVDTEHMLGLLSSSGMTVTDDETLSDVIIVNTCCFIHDAKEESIEAILEMAKLRKNGRCRCLIVTGCLAQRYRREILDEIPEVDAVLGTGSADHLADTINDVLGGGRVSLFDPIDRNAFVTGKRLLTTGGHYAYLKIAEGCDKHCTYCIIPSIRGRYRSYPMEDLIQEAKELAGAGVRELILVAQETTLYGVDLYGKKMLHALIRSLAEIPSITWIRVLYCYPEEIYDELIETMRSEPKFCHYLDLPIQHASNTVLKRMGRRTSKEDLEDIIRKLRKEIPDIALRTTLITGFPGETQQQHEETMAFIDEMEFDRLGVFTYSAEENTPAASMPDQIEPEIMEKRRDELMSLQQEIAFDLAERKTGMEMTVMVEGRIADDDVYVCRTEADAPGVDGYLFLQTGEVLMSGDFVKVRVTGANEYDLIGEMLK